MRDLLHSILHTLLDSPARAVSHAWAIAQGVFSPFGMDRGQPFPFSFLLPETIGNGRNLSKGSIGGYPTGTLPDEHLYAAISIKEAESSQKISLGFNGNAPSQKIEIARSTDYRNPRNLAE